MTFRLVSVVAALGLVGCGTAISFIPTGSGTPRAPIQPHEVAIFTSSAPARGYLELGILQARQESEFSVHELPDVMEEMRAAAAEHGCDGLIIQGRADAVEDGIDGPETLEGFYGTCVAWTE